MSMPEWLVVGGEVGTYTLGALAIGSTTRSTIDRIGKRDVILADGQRFNVRSLRCSTSTWGPTTYLTSVDDRSFLAAEAKDAVARTSRRVEALMRDWRGGDAAALTEALRILEAAQS